MKRTTAATESRATRYRRRLNNSLQWEDVDKVAALSTADASSPIALLSQPLLREGVFAFLVPSLDKPESFVNDLNLPQCQAMLTPVRLVCRHWDRLAQMLLNDATNCVCTSELSALRPSQLIARLRRMESHGPNVKQLQFTATNWRWSMPPANVMSVDWNRFFARLPNIVRLDVSAIDDVTLKLMLPASSQACPQVKDLALNCVYGRSSWRPDIRDDLIAALSEALQAWYTANGGLHALTIPLWVQRQEAYTPFLMSVADYCPQMKYLRGRAPPDDDGGTRYGNQPTVSADDWSTFCRRCPEIKTHTGTPGLFYSA